jgi:hypothetical protein
MNIDPATIAVATTSVLAPYLPQLVQGAKFVGEKIAGAAVGEVGKQAFVKAKSLWDRLCSREGKSAKVQKAAELAALDEKDTDALKTLTKAIFTLVSEDKELSESLAQLIGGQEGVQEVLSVGNAWVEEVSMDLTGSGTQAVRALDGGVIKGVRMTKK